jgi:hypothetical protein
VSCCQIADARFQSQMILETCIGLKSILENLRATSGRAVHVPVTESRLTGSMYL